MFISDESIYMSLDSARSELSKRRSDIKLKQLVEEELATVGLISVFKSQGPRAVIWRSMMTPDNGFDFFYHSSKYIGCEPSPLEYLSDKFVTINQEKKALSKLSLITDNLQFAHVDIADTQSQEGIDLASVILKDGGKLSDFHRSLFKITYYQVTPVDISDWCTNIGKSQDYYYYYLLHFLYHGVLFECFSFEISRENEFTNNVILPAIKKIYDKFGILPIVVRLYPLNQTDSEDFYWFSYPKVINDHIINYSIRNNLKFNYK